MVVLLPFDHHYYRLIYELIIQNVAMVHCIMDPRSGHTRLRQARIIVGRLLNEGELADFLIFLHTLDCADFPLSLTVTYCHKTLTKLFLHSAFWPWIYMDAPTKPQEHVFAELLRMAVRFSEAVEVDSDSDSLSSDFHCYHQQ